MSAGVTSGQQQLDSHVLTVLDRVKKHFAFYGMAADFSVIPNKVRGHPDEGAYCRE